MKSVMPTARKDYVDAFVRVRALSNGFDPDTGRALPADHLCQRPQNIRALVRATELLTAYLEQGAPRRVVAHPAEQPENAENPWTQSEDRRLVYDLHCGKSYREMARAFGRRVGSIRQRAIELGYGQGVKPLVRVRARSARAAEPDLP